MITVIFKLYLYLAPLDDIFQQALHTFHSSVMMTVNTNTILSSNKIQSLTCL